MRRSELNVSITVSDPFGTPANDDNAPIFAPRSNPASFPFESLTGPVVTSLSTGPLIVRSAFIVPSLRDAPEGSVTPTAGNTDSRSEVGMPAPISFIATDGVTPEL